MAHRRQKRALGDVRRIRRVFRLPQLPFRLLALRHVGEGEDAAEHVLLHRLRARTALDGAIVGQLEGIQRVRLVADQQPQKTPLAAETLGHLPPQVMQDGTVVAAMQHLVGNPPDRGEATVEVDNPPIEIEHQNALRRRFQGGRKQRAG